MESSASRSGGVQLGLHGLHGRLERLDLAMRFDLHDDFHFAVLGWSLSTYRGKVEELGAENGERELLTLVRHSCFLLGMAQQLIAPCWFQLTWLHPR